MEPAQILENNQSYNKHSAVTRPLMF